MAQKTVCLPEIGELTLSKRRGARNIRLSVSASGRIRVGLPAWMPYSAGISFALARQDWLLKHKAKHLAAPLGEGARIGKSYRLRYQYEPDRAGTLIRLSGAELIVKSGHLLSDSSVQAKVRTAAERALRKEADRLLPPRLQELARRHGFTYRSVKVKKLTSRWGSCTTQKNITLNFFLMQLPWQFIDYVLIHELVHTKHMNHSPAFWNNFEKIYPDAKAVRQQINNCRPIINSLGSTMA
ncbi:MAG TPA: SprT family zinc-dependent metalloprotease [Candidatus Saccharimonadales bacterium]|nr:SprT family zinc-dependent metalloprotease [Candidatus Saccharimonadales bacterium]